MGNLSRSSPRLLYIANARIPSRRTNSIQVMKMCAAFSEAGAETVLALPFRWRSWFKLRYHADDVWNWYAVEAPFAVRSVLHPYWDRRSRKQLFARFAVFLAKRLGPDLVYTRNLSVACRLSSMGLPVAFESHDFDWDRNHPEFDLFVRKWARRDAFRGLIAISQGLAQRYRDRHFPAKKLHVLHDGVDLDRFASPMHHREARRLLGLPEKARIVCHCGNMSRGRGMTVLMKAVAKLDDDVVLVLVGGDERNLAPHRRRAAELGIEHRCVFAGYVANRVVPRYLWAANVLVMASTESSPVAPYTSPLKMFEYMAAQRPIVATRLPTIEEVLEDGRNALLVPPGQDEGLARAVRGILDYPSLGRRLATEAARNVEAFTWKRRARAILDRLDGGRGG